MKQRILIFSLAYEPLIGGAELAVRSITDRLLNFEFDLVTCRFSRVHATFEKIGNVNVYRVGFGSRLGRYFYPVLAYRLAVKLNRQSHYQIIWSIMAAYAGAAALLFARRHPETKLLLTLQEGDSIEHIHGRVRSFKKQWQALFKRADYIQTISKFLANWARQEGAICPLAVVPNGVDLGKFTNMESRISNAEKKIITVSRLVPKNGVDILVRAAAVLKNHISHFVFRIQIVGSGPEEDKLKNLAKDLGIENQVEFVGNISQEKLPSYLFQADVFARPSRSEGLGTSFLEAMAAGLPVVATNVGGIPDFLTDRKTGLFCQSEDPQDLADKLAILMTDDKLRDVISRNARRLVEQDYSWDNIALEMSNIFQSLCQVAN